jgi:hypothetical protein
LEGVPEVLIRHGVFLMGNGVFFNREWGVSKDMPCPARDARHIRRDLGCCSQNQEPISWGMGYFISEWEDYTGNGVLFMRNGVLSMGNEVLSMGNGVLSMGNGVLSMGNGVLFKW